MKTKATATVNVGATIQRSMIRRKIKRMISLGISGQAQFALEELLKWIDSEPKRTAAKKGGLGKK